MDGRAAPPQLETQVLTWSNGLMAARSLDQFAASLARPPAAEGESLTGVLLLLDPMHELRRLAVGDGTQADSWPGLRSTAWPASRQATARCMCHGLARTTRPIMAC